MLLFVVAFVILKSFIYLYSDLYYRSSDIYFNLIITNLGTNPVIFLMSLNPENSRNTFGEKHIDINIYLSKLICNVLNLNFVPQHCCYSYKLQKSFKHSTIGTEVLYKNGSL